MRYFTKSSKQFRACEYLVRKHSERGDKIIIFSDDVPALILYCKQLSKVSEQAAREIQESGSSSADRISLALLTHSFF